MITIFNRKGLFITYDMQKQSEVRTVLENNKIAHKVAVKNITTPSPFSSGSRARTGSLGIDLNSSYEYKIYVKKADYEKAAYLLKTTI